MRLKKRAQIAKQPEVIRTAMKFAFIVGPVLIIINHGDKILVGEMQQLDWLKCLVTLIVPYTVSTLSSVSAYIACQDENDET
ncbi:MAG: nitrate/nitrite transporter NrtS [Ghiorsea sp.]